MSHTNKRYVVYDSYWFNHGYLHEHGFIWKNNVTWNRRVYTKKQLIDRLAFWINKKEIKVVADISLVTPADTYYNKIKINSSRPGVKEWDIIRLTLICVKVIKDGEEKDVNLKGLWREAKKVHERISARNCRHRSLEWAPPPVNWKKKYKCKHQYEIHFNPHKDTIKFSSKKLGEICLGSLIGKTAV